jgi:predicted esterase
VVLKVHKPRFDSKLGVVLATKDGKLTATTVKEGSATEAAGLTVGDVVVKINGAPAPARPADATALLKAAGAGTIELTLERLTAIDVSDDWVEPPRPPLQRLPRKGPLQLLFLHGNGDNAMLSQSFIAPAIVKAVTGGAKVDCPSGDVKWTKEDIESKDTISAELKEMALSGDVELFGWYRNKPREYVDTVTDPGHPLKGNINVPTSRDEVQQAVDKVAKHIVSKGGFDGIVGFSQGFTMAMALAEQLEQINAKCARKITFIAGFGMTLTHYIARELEGASKPFVVPPCAQTPLGPLKVFLCSGTEDVHAGPKRMERVRRIWASAGAYTASHTFQGGHKMPHSGHKVFTELDGFI